MQPNDALEFYPLATLFPPLNHWVGASGLSTKVDLVVAVEAATVEIWHSATTELGCPPTAPHPHDLTPLGWSYHATVTRYTPVIAGWGEPFPGFSCVPSGFLRAPEVLVEQILLQCTVATPWDPRGG